MQKGTNYCLLLKTWVKVEVINMIKKLLIVLKKSTTDAIKTASRRAIQKTAQATGDLIGNKIADKITSVSKKKSTKELRNSDETKEDVKIAFPKKRYISPEKRKQSIEELGLVPKKYVLIKIHISRRKINY